MSSTSDKIKQIIEQTGKTVQSINPNFSMSQKQQEQLGERILSEIRKVSTVQGAMQQFLNNLQPVGFSRTDLKSEKFVEAAKVIDSVSRRLESLKEKDDAPSQDRVSNLQKIQKSIKRGASSEELEELLSLENKYAYQSNEEALPEQIDASNAAKLQLAQNNRTLQYLRASRRSKSPITKAKNKVKNFGRAAVSVAKEELSQFGKDLLGPASFAIPMASKVLTSSFKALTNPVETVQRTVSSIKDFGRSLNPKNLFSSPKTEEERELEKQNKALDKIVKALKKSEYQAAVDEKRNQTNSDLLTQISSWVGNFIPMLTTALGLATVLGGLAAVGKVIETFVGGHPEQFGELVSAETQAQPEVQAREQNYLLSKRDTEKYAGFLTGLSDEDFKTVVGRKRTALDNVTSATLRFGAGIEELFGVERGTGNLADDLISGSSGKDEILYLRSLTEAKTVEEARKAIAALASRTRQQTGTSIKPATLQKSATYVANPLLGIANDIIISSNQNKQKKYEAEVVRNSNFPFSKMTNTTWNPATGKFEERSTVSNPINSIVQRSRLNAPPLWEQHNPSIINNSTPPAQQHTVVNQISNNFTLPKVGIGNSGVQ